LDALLVVAFLALNSLLNLTNKWVLSVYHFRFPLLLTACHMSFSFCALLPFMLTEPYKSRHADTIKKQWKGLFAIGLFMAANISLNNVSLMLITLSLNQVIRSSIPVCTATTAVLIEHRIPSLVEATALVILSLGVMMAIFEGVASANVSGIALCCLGTVSNAAMVSTSGKLLSEKLDVIRLTFYTAPVSCTFLLPLFLMKEWSAFTQHISQNNYGVGLVLLCSSAVALLYNVVHALMIQKTSAVTVTVLGEIKVLGLLLLSAYLLDEKRIFTPAMSVGVALAMIGFGIYTHSKVQTLRQKAYEANSQSTVDGVPYAKMENSSRL